MKKRRFWLLYPSWIAVCALLFVLLGGAEDPSRRRGRILSNEAAAKALEYAKMDGLRGYEVVHVAYARAGEGGAENRWIVLLDRVPHTGLEEVRVFELRAEDGTLLRMRTLPY